MQGRPDLHGIRDRLRTTMAPGIADLRALPVTQPATAHRRSAAGAPVPRGLAAKKTSTRPRPHRSAIIAAMLGFGAGIVFWHFVGFWSFVSHAVFKADRNTVVESSASHGGDDQRKQPTTIFGGIPPADTSSSTACTTLRLDRTTGRTSMLACDSPGTMAASTSGRRWSFTPPGNPRAERRRMVNNRARPGDARLVVHPRRPISPAPFPRSNAGLLPAPAGDTVAAIPLAAIDDIEPSGETTVWAI